MIIVEYISNLKHENALTQQTLYTQQFGKLKQALLKYHSQFTSQTLLLTLGNWSLEIKN
jgi:hypothetical protein